MLVKLSAELDRFDSITEANNSEDEQALLKAARENLRTLNAIMIECQRQHWRYHRQVISLRDLIKNMTGDHGARN